MTAMYPLIEVSIVAFKCHISYWSLVFEVILQHSASQKKEEEEEKMAAVKMIFVVAAVSLFMGPNIG